MVAFIFLLGNQNQQTLHTSIVKITPNLIWKQIATTIIGYPYFEGSQGRLQPQRIHISSDQQTLYILDRRRDYIIKWSLTTKYDQLNFLLFINDAYIHHELNQASDFIVNEKNRSFIICDRGKRRVVRCSIENQRDKQILIENVDCYGLMMNENEDLFVSDSIKNVVIKWKKGEKNGTIVAGGNGKGEKLDQLNEPTFIFVDRNDTVYISDKQNHRVIKWMKYANEGILVPSTKDQKNSFKQISRPTRVIVKNEDDVYVADCDNDRIIYWPLGLKESQHVVGGNGRGSQSNQFRCPMDFVFDKHNNLYVADFDNYRIQRFDIDRY